MLSISIDELLRLNYPNIIDIRNEQNFNNNHIPGAKNIPYEKLMLKPNLYLDKNNKYYIYCQKGITSAKLCSRLTSFGYKVSSVIGGYEAWILKY